MKLPDVQNAKSPHSFRLTRVGITGVRKPVRVTRSGSEHTLNATIDVYVDLPPEQRGTHMSRNVEAVAHSIDAFAKSATSGLENFALDVARALLDKHAYATTAEVDLEADYFRERKTPQNQAPTIEHYVLVARSAATRGGPVRKAIGVRVTGMSACPCAMEGTRAILTQQGHAVAGFPTITHNQRNNVLLLVETAATAESPEANDLIDLVEEALSAPTYEYLKRGDETALVLRAHDNPRFVEDVVREALARVLKRYGHYADNTLIVCSSEAEESIHKHNAVAERVTTLGELRG